MGFLNKFSNIPGWRTQRKIIIIESDDWGSLRSPAKNALESMQNKCLPLGNYNTIRFNKFDDLASSEDLESLFEVLDSVEDSMGNSAIFTALSLVANPDFQKIKEFNFEKYYYKDLPKSLEQQNKSKAWKLWCKGYQDNLFIPEFHGREHLNVASWMRDLRQNDATTIEGFENQFWGFKKKPNSVSYQAAFDLELADDINLQQDIVKDGLKLFDKLHGRKAQFFVPPNGSLNQKLELVAADQGIKYMCTSKIFKEPLGGGRTKTHYRYLGKTNINGQVYLTRNASFEPSSLKKSDWVDACLKQIETAFKFKKPATISSHRINYIGTKDLKNRDHGLRELKGLLNKIISKWPNVEFRSSSELGSLISKE